MKKPCCLSTLLSKAYISNSVPNFVRLVSRRRFLLSEHFKYRAENPIFRFAVSENRAWRNAFRL